MPRKQLMDSPSRGPLAFLLPTFFLSSDCYCQPHDCRGTYENELPGWASIPSPCNEKMRAPLKDESEGEEETTKELKDCSMRIIGNHTSI